jgi:hypothetical protein
VPAFGSIAVSTLVAQQQANVLCPAGTATNDLLVIFGLNDEPFGYLTPAGFLPLANPSAVASDIGSAMFYRFATSGDVAGTTSYAMKNSGATGNQPNIAACARITGVDPAWAPTFSNTTPTNLNPVSADVGLAHGGGAGSVTTAANAACQAPANPTSVAATDYVLRVYMSGDDATGTGKTFSTTAPASWTARGSYISNVTGKFNVGMIVCDRIGAVDTATITTNHISIFDVYTIAIPAAPAASTTGKFLPFFRAPGHHEDELERRPSGLYVQRQRVFGYRAPSRVLALTG